MMVKELMDFLDKKIDAGHDDQRKATLIEIRDIVKQLAKKDLEDFGFKGYDNFYILSKTTKRTIGSNLIKDLESVVDIKDVIKDDTI